MNVKGEKKEMDFRDTDGKDVQAAGPRTRYLGLYSRFSNRPLVDCTLSGTPNLPLTLVAQRTGTRTRPRFRLPRSKKPTRYVARNALFGSFASLAI